MGHHKGASRMGRPKKLDDRVSMLIKNWATIDPYYKDMSRDALAEALITELEKQGLAAPTHETMKKYISKYRNQPDSSEDLPWHTGLLKDNLSPEVISKIGAIQHLGKLSSQVVSVRQSRWISKLYLIVEDIESLGEISWYYTMYEKLCYPNAPDMSPLDAALPDKEKFRQTFSRLVLGFDFSAYQKAFRQTSGAELAGFYVDFDGIYFKDGSAFAVKQWLVNGELRKVIVKNMGPQENVIPKFVKEKFINKRRSYPKYIALKKPLALEITPAEWTELQQKLKELA